MKEKIIVAMCTHLEIASFPKENGEYSPVLIIAYHVVWEQLQSSNSHKKSNAKIKVMFGLNAQFGHCFTTLAFSPTNT